MPENAQYRRTTHKALVGRVACGLLALGAVSGSIVAQDVAGAASGVVLSTTTTPAHGTILVSGKTVYTLKASKTRCTAQCLKIWPALMLPKGVTKATAGAGVSASKLGTVKRSGGALQVTYSGKPLYFFVGDTVAGQVNGNVSDTWGKWSDVVTAKSAPSSSGSGSNSGAGSGAGTNSGAGSGGSTAGTGGVSF
jgi:predicted lipoprotein with Yx(FWY)xxD motif